MLPKIFVFLVICVVLIKSETKRVKRAKYYSYPTRFYRKPPPPHVVKGYFSYTPPPNNMSHDEHPPYKPKVSRKPTNEGLDDDDINNLVKNLSQKDLDKIIEFAGGNERHTERYKDDSSERVGYDGPYKRPERGYKLEDIENISFNVPYIKEQDDRPYKVEYSQNYVTIKPILNTRYHEEYVNKIANQNFIQDAKSIYSNAGDSNTKIVYVNAQDSQIIPSRDLSNDFAALNNPSSIKTVYSSYQPNSPNQAILSNSQFDTEETIRKYVTYVTPPTSYNENIYTNSNNMQEEQLPKPLNLRENEDFDVSFSNKVPKVVKAESYQVESIKDVPLMNGHDSKLYTVSSYHVPHYLVTSTNSQSFGQSASLKSRPPPVYSRNPPIEKAPPGYTGREQSDSHLKAVKIWTHHSRGMAYTLHDDGTLSPEKPGKPKSNYGYS